ncbi:MULTISPECIES: DMT family transporter [Dietzia]|jgi:small multidrug resistance pump|uniref:DMT family transporter n=1 Tax=Dietzia TaxID=37914 RepID=UPI0021AFE7C5|nr:MULTISPECIES: SMR family transporter [Dietzia]MCT1434315.1 SMR family transporter [Dietzia maris]MCT1521304.1 SMR family transporter [Dietzia maris]MCY1655684.1 SMR family transporter [Dietzia sp. SL131]
MTALALIGLVCAIIGEVIGTVSLRMASAGKKVWWIGVGAGYVFAFVMLSVALAQGLPLGVAYGIWAAAGVAITAILSRIFFKEPLTRVMGLGIVLIVVGVLLIELGAAH